MRRTSRYCESSSVSSRNSLKLVHSSPVILSFSANATSSVKNILLKRKMSPACLSRELSSMNFFLSANKTLSTNFVMTKLFIMRVLLK
jgi:hypothetical protein